MRGIRTARWVLVLTLTTLAAACADAREPTGVEALAPAARAHLDELLGVMQTFSLRRQEIDWSALRRDVYAAAAGARSVPDTYAAIRLAIQRLGDGHTFYVAAVGPVIAAPTRSCSAPSGPAPAVPDNVGYVQVTGFSGTSSEALAYANALQAGIRAVDRDELIGWIVDLRGNGGGNMWPMIAGVGPVLGEGVVGHFVDPSGGSSAWEYRDGGSWLEGMRLQHVDAPYTLRRPAPRVAVLTDQRVASSGEAVAIAFRGRPGTRTFGSATCGLSTANSGFLLADGARLFLTVAVMADRAGTRYGDVVPPDEVVAEWDQVVQRAVAWVAAGD